MAEKFRSYQMARLYFTILERGAWVILIIGGLILLIGLLGNLEASGRQPTSIWEDPEPSAFGPFFSSVFSLFLGAVMAFMGFFCVASAQYFRAGVDSAEYGQQMLAIARESLEVSRQQQQKNDPPKSFAELAQEAEGAAPTKASFADAAAARKGSSASASLTASDKKGSAAIAGMTESVFMGISMHTDGEKFIVDGREFESRTSAQSYALELSKAAKDKS